MIGPAAAAATPTVPGANVISLFSDAYTDVPVDTWRTIWSNPQTTVDDVTVSGNPTKLYEGLRFVGVETIANQIDITNMTHVHFDVWTPNPTSLPTEFKFKLVDFGPNGVFDGVGVADDTEHELIFTAATTPALSAGGWISFELPLTDFTGLTGRANISQLVFAGDIRTFYLDNLYFHN